MRYILIVFVIILLIFACTKKDYIEDIIIKDKVDTLQLNKKTKMIKPKGIYAVQTYVDKAQESTILTNPNIKGFFIRLKWSTVNPSEGVYDWTLLDKDIDNAIKNNKVVSVSIIAGEYSPDWLETYTPFIEFSISNHGGTGKINNAKMPAPYANRFKIAYREMLLALKDHLTATDRYEAVEFMKFGGINQSTAETRLPYQFDAVEKWLENDYTLYKILDTYDYLYTTYKDIFKDKYISTAIIGDPNGFPNIDLSGKEISDKDNNSTVNLIEVGINQHKDVLIIQFNAVTATGGTPLDEISNYATVAYQEQMSGTKSDQYVIDVTTNVIAHNGAFLELFNKTIKSYPKGVEDASKLFK